MPVRCVVRKEVRTGLLTIALLNNGANRKRAAIDSILRHGWSKTFLRVESLTLLSCFNSVQSQMGQRWFLK